MNKKKARIALRKSIKHWCLDIRKPLIKGKLIYDENWMDGTKVKMFSNSCDMCKIYGNRCFKCMLSIIGSRCEDRSSEYSMFRRKLNLESANNMIAVLVRCYKEVL